MSKIIQTDVTGLKLKKADLLLEHVLPEKESLIDWQAASETPRGLNLLKNLGVVSAIILCVLTLRAGAVPSLNDATDAVLTIATDHSLLNEQLGKLSFVSALFPESVLVFGENTSLNLILPVKNDEVIHAWSEGEPYISMRTQCTDVISLSAGEVSNISHGNGDEMLVQISLDNDTACLYGNLNSVSVKIGECVHTGSILGTLPPGEDLVFELKQNGVSINPQIYLQQ